MKNKIVNFLKYFALTFTTIFIAVISFKLALSVGIKGLYPYMFTICNLVSFYFVIKERI